MGDEEAEMASQAPMPSKTNSKQVNKSKFEFESTIFVCTHDICKVLDSLGIGQA